jgi:hypothetical protein
MNPNTGGRVPMVVWGVGVLVVVHALSVAVSLDAPERIPLVHDVTGWAGALVGVLGTVAATRAFGRGDYLRQVWASSAAGAVLLLVGTALRSYWTHAAPGTAFLDSPLLPYRMVVVVAANVFSTLALILMVRTYRRSGLQAPPSVKVNVLTALGGAVALALAVMQLRVDLPRLALGGTHAVSAVTSMASTLCDFATILLVVPLLRVAYMLRGGRLAQVWWVMGLSGAVWLIYDVRELLAAAMPGGDATAALEFLRVSRTLGLSLLGVAGILQRVALAPAAAGSPRVAVDAPTAA